MPAIVTLAGFVALGTGFGAGNVAKLAGTGNGVATLKMKFEYGQLLLPKLPVCPRS